jgi:hypothetical protein
LLCLAQFYELHCKVILLRAGVATRAQLAKKLYSHDICYMWQQPALQDTRTQVYSAENQHSIEGDLQALCSLTTGHYELRYPDGPTPVFKPDLLLRVGFQIVQI